ncbi:MAG: hypothetical protein IPK87_16145 [Planctomycetes bacterium]|nr:hypothetical protein [Planctomycetota bacterium]
MSADDKGLRTAGMALWAVGFVFVILCFLLYFELLEFARASHKSALLRELWPEADPDAFAQSHWLWAAPLVVFSGALAVMLGRLVAGFAAGLRWRPFALGMTRSMLPGLHYQRWLPRDDTNLPGRYARLLWGGPVGTLLLLVATIGGFAWATAAGHALWRDVLCLLSAGAAFWAAGQIFPDAHKGLPNTGWLIASLSRRGARAKRFCALALLAGQHAQGAGPAGWDTALVVQALSPSDGTTHEVEALLVAAMHHTAINEPARAREVLGRAMLHKTLLGKHGVRKVEEMLSHLPQPE